MEKLHEFRKKLNELIDICVQQNDLETIKNILKQVVKSGNIIHMFGTGHSHAITEEFFYRAGGLVCVNAMLEEPLMVHGGAEISSMLERTENYAELILRKHNPSQNDAIIIFSNSGINAVPVEMAICAKKAGLCVIALTSAQANSKTPPRNSEGKHLSEVADYVIDTHVPYGDAVIDLPGGIKTGPVSSLINITIVHGILAQLSYELSEEGVTPPIFVSANIPGGSEMNKIHFSNYRSRIRGL